MKGIPSKHSEGGGRRVVASMGADAEEDFKAKTQREQAASSSMIHTGSPPSKGTARKCRIHL